MHQDGVKKQAEGALSRLPTNGNIKSDLIDALSVFMIVPEIESKEAKGNDKEHDVVNA